MIRIKMSIIALLTVEQNCALLIVGGSIIMRIYTHSTCIQHKVPEGHSEQPDRLIHLLAHLDHTGISREIPYHQATPIHQEQALKVHDLELYQELERLTPKQGLVPADPDTWVSPQSQKAAMLAAGAVQDATTAIILGEDNRAFCAVRPPGHHAERNAMMGFCLFNSVAISAALALEYESVSRVAILDFDVHHGNGTVDIFKDDPRVLVCSSFQDPLYPNRYFDLERPHIINTPLKAGSNSNQFRSAISNSWWPAIEAHKPDLIFVSAGFDAHELDPLADINLTENDFRWITQEIVRYANQYAKGRIISALEGGYHLEALAASAHAHIEELCS